MGNRAVLRSQYRSSRVSKASIFGLTVEFPEESAEPHSWRGLAGCNGGAGFSEREFDDAKNDGERGPSVAGTLASSRDTNAHQQADHRVEED